MPERAPDHKQRSRALDCSRSFIVQAPAGSGKTALLIQRFLALLARVSGPEAIVAITFTRKAAAEMRHRVMAALRSASGPRPLAPHEVQTWRLAREVIARDKNLAWRLTEHPARLRIQTIDSLCAMLVRQMPWLSRMGAGMRPHDNAGQLYRKAARRTLAMLGARGTPEEVSNALAIVYSHLDNNAATLERLLGDMLGRRDQWLRYVHGSSPDLLMRERLESAIAAFITADLKRLEAAFPARHRAETVALARFAAGNLEGDAPGSPIHACRGLAQFPDATANALPAWQGIAELFVTGAGKRRKSLNKNLGFPPTAAGRSAKERLKAIELAPEVITLLYELRFAPPSRFDEGQWTVLASLMRLLPVAVGGLRQVFQDEGSVDFTEIAIRAQDAIGPGKTPGGAVRPLDYPIRHLLIDEFQDTSQSQFDLLSRLIRDWQPEDGRTVFAVGDPMQSIYGFREAEVGLFLRARKRGIGGVSLEALTLSTNFRSSTAIVEWVNHALSKAFPQSEDVLTGGVTYEPSVAFKGEIAGSAVQIHPFFSKDPIPEAERVLEIIDEAQTGRPDETIAVLVQARSHLAGIVSALRQRGRKFRAVEIDALGERPVVRDLMSLTLALMHPGDRIAWLSILRAPWCGLTLADLEALAGESAIWDQLQNPAALELMSPDGRMRLGRVIPLFREALALKGKLPVRRWVEAVWIALGGPACLRTRTELEDAAAYLDLLEGCVDGPDLRDEKQFAKDVSGLFASADDEGSGKLELMTIHKAKGLEFDTVILPGLGRTTRPADNPLLLVREFMDGDRSSLVLAPIKATGGEMDYIYAYLNRIERKRQRNEKTRLLYVAATRARTSLHLLGHAKVDPERRLFRPRAESLLRKLRDTAEPVFLAALPHGAEEEASDEPPKEVPAGIPLTRVTSGWVPAEPPPDAEWTASSRAGAVDAEEPQDVTYEWAGDLQRRLGVVVHNVLQRLHVPEQEQFGEDTLRAALSHEGLHGDALDEAVSLARVALTNTLSDERGRWILSRHDSDKREFALATVEKGRVRHIVVDRTFVDAGKRWIIDYKTGTHTGGDLESFLDDERERYRAQLEGYARALRSMDSRPVPIYLGLYFPMLRGWRQWRYDSGQEPVGRM